jgi:hypothetical protein
MAAESAAKRAKFMGKDLTTQAIAGARAASEVGTVIASDKHATSKEIHQTAIAAARVGAEKIVTHSSTQTDHPQEIIEQAVAVVAKAPPPPPPPPPPPKQRGFLVIQRAKERAKHQGLSPGVDIANLAKLAVQKAKEREERRKAKAEFGRRLRFGSVCTNLLPKDTATCVNYTENGMYPCNWSGGKNSRCQTRKNVVSLETVLKGLYRDFIKKTPGLEQMKEVKVTEPVAPIAVKGDKTLSELCKRLGWNKCTVDPNCHRQNGPKTGKRCVAKPGTKGTKRIFHGPVNKNNNQSVPDTKEKMDFGRRKTKKVPDSIKATCKKLKIRLTRTVGGKRVPKALNLLKKQIKAKK